MSRIYKTLLAIACVVIWCGAALGANAPKYRMREVNRPPVDSRRFVPPTIDNGRTFGASRNIGTASNPNAVEMGKTFYDFQHNDATGRQVDEFNGKVEVSWMKAPGPSETDRFVNWNRTQVAGAVGSVNPGYVPLGAPLTPLGQQFSAVRPGYTNTRMRAGGKNVTTYHDAPETGGVQYWESQLDLSAGSGVFAGSPSQSPNPPGPEYVSDAVIWPKTAISTCGGDQIHHAVGTWSGASNEVWYWRGVINDGLGSIAWSGGQPTVMDPVSAALSVVVEANGSDVTVAMGKSVNSTNADVIYYRSTDCGVNWAAPVNVTNYSAAGAEGFWAEIGAVYDAAGSIHLIFNTAPANGADAPVNLYHWSSGTGLRLITSAGWSNSCGGGTLETGTGNGGGARNLAIAEPNISVKPAGVHGALEQLYAVWTQYGPTDTDCATVDAIGTLGGYVNAEIYVSVSTNGGLTWDRPQNVTQTETPDCLPGNCASEAWVTSAAQADSGLYLSYVDDTHAGAIVFGGGAWTECPYRAMAPEARAAVLEPVIAVSPIKFIELNADPAGGIEVATLNIISVGNDNLTYTVAVTNVGGGLSFVTVDGGPSATNTILAGGAPDAIVVGYNATGLSNPSEHNWQLSVTSNDPQNDPGQGGSPILVDLQVFAANPWFTCDQDTLSTGTHRMKVSSCLEMGDQGTDGTGFFDYSDSAEYMYSGSPVVTLIRGGDTLAYHNAFMGLADRTRDENKSFRAQSLMTVQRNVPITVADSSYQADIATGQGSTTDTTIDIDYEIVFPRKSNLANGFVYRLTMRSLTGAPITGVHYGVAADIDVDPSAGENAGAGNSAKGWIGAVGGTSDDSANFTPNTQYMAIFHLPQGSSCDRTGADAAQVLANPNYVVPDNAYDTDSLHKVFKTFGALGSWGTNIHIDTGQQYDDVSVLLVSGYNKVISNTTPTTWAYGVATTKVGTADLEATIEALRSSTHAPCQVACTISLSGDVNNNGQITTADIIALVNYVLKSGIPPVPCIGAGDINCNGQVTTADIIALVNFVLKSGAAPCDICANSALAAGCI